jgi:hypothetical protein
LVSTIGFAAGNCNALRKERRLGHLLADVLAILDSLDIVFGEGDRRKLSFNWRWLQPLHL